MFYEEGSRVLTADAFDFILEAELKRALRSQQFITLTLWDVTREWEGITVKVDRAILLHVGSLVAACVRGTDAVAGTASGTLALALLDADLACSRHVIDRVLSNIEPYAFPTALRIVINAACYPTDAATTQELKQQAEIHPIAQWRGQAGQASRRGEGGDY